MARKYPLLALFTLFILGLFLFSCTNPEVDFPDEDKKKPKIASPKLTYQTPTLLVYPEGSGPEIFYYFIALARANGASDILFLPVPAEQKAVTEGIETLKGNHGKKPSVFGVYIDPILFVNLKNKIEHFVFLEPKRAITESSQVSVISLAPLQKANPQTPPQKTTPAKENSQTLSEKKADEKKSQDTKAKKTSPADEAKNIKDETDRKNETPNPQTKPESSKKPETTPDFRSKMKNFTFLSQIVKKLIPEPKPDKEDKSKSQTPPKKLSLGTGTASPEETLYIKGKTLPYSKLSLLEQGKENKWTEKFSVASNRDGLFNALIIRPAKSFSLKLTYENQKQWNFQIIGLQFTSPFLSFNPGSDSIAEIHSFFSPIPLENFDLANKPKLKKLLEAKFKKDAASKSNTTAIHSIYFRKGELKIEQNKEILLIWMPEKFLPVKIKLEKKTIDIKPKNTLYILK